MELTSENVNQVFHDCLFAEGEDTTTHVLAEGIVHKVGFHPGRLESHREDIRGMLSRLPASFHRGTGDGWSFLNACEDRDGNTWTGSHSTMEQLFLLGTAIGVVELCLPRELWNALPGGMPYYRVNVA